MLGTVCSTVTLGMDNEYCSDDDKVICNREAVGAWEKFKAYRHRSWPANTVALYSGHTGMACSDEGIPHKPPKFNFYYDNLSIATSHPACPRPQP